MIATDPDIVVNKILADLDKLAATARGAAAHSLQTQIEETIEEAIEQLKVKIATIRKMEKER